MADLRDLGVRHFQVGTERVDLEFVFKRGGSYQTYLDNNYLFERARLTNADVVLVILGGNAISNDVTNPEIYAVARKFYTKLRESFPNSKIIAAQVECRYYQPENRWNCPSGKGYCKRRIALNNFLKRLKTKDHILMISGDNRLDQEKYYHDAVHLNTAGLRYYLDCIKKVVNFILGGHK